MKKVMFTAFALWFCLTANLYAQDFSWFKKVAGTAQDWGEAIENDSNGNLFLSGGYMGTVDLDPGLGSYNVTAVGSYDIYIAKYDSNGNFIWGRTLGGSNAERADNGLKVDGNGNVYICGFFRGTVDFDPSTNVYNLSTGGAYADGFILKLDSNGNFVYAKQIGSSNADDHVYSIDIDLNGFLIATGYFQNTADLDPGASQFNVTSQGSTDCFVLKLDLSGNFIWGKSIGGTQASIGKSIIFDPQNNIILCGNYAGSQDCNPGTGSFDITSNGATDLFLVKLDNTGNFIYGKAIGSLFLCGRFSGNCDFDSGAGVNNLLSNGGFDGYTLCLNSNGDFIWVNQIGGISDDFCQKLSIDENNNVFISGYFQNTVDFDQSNVINNITSNGMKDIFLVSCSSSGSLVYAQNYGGISDDESYNILYSQSKVFLTGYFESAVDFDYSANNYIANSLGSSDGFILCLNNNFCTQTVYNTVTIYDTVTVYTTVTDTLIINTTLGLPAPNNENTILIYPNPASDHITIDYGTFTIMNGYQLKIENSAGQQVFQTMISQQSDYISLSSLGGNGLYYVKTIDPQGNTVDIKKIIIQ